MSPDVRRAYLDEDGAELADSTAVARALGVETSAVTNWRHRGTGPLVEPVATVASSRAADGRRPYWTTAQVADMRQRYRLELERKLRRIERRLASLERTAGGYRRLIAHLRDTDTCAAADENASV